MAVTVTPNLTNVAIGESADSGTWLGTSGGYDTEVYKQGAGSYTYQTGKNSREACSYTLGASANMSGTGTHLYWWMRCDVMPFCEVKTTGTTTASGLTVRVESSATDFIEWHISGSDVWDGSWRCFVVDINNTSQIYASGGTLNRAAVTKITWYTDNSNSGNIRIIDNTWMDVVRYGTGLTLTGTDFDLIDAAAVDQSVSNQYGILENIDGVIFCQGKLTIGNGATTTTFTSDNEQLTFRERAGGTFGIVSSSLYELIFTGSGCTADITSLTAKSAGSVDALRFYLDASDTNADVTMDGCNITRAGLLDFASTSDIQNSVFNNCFQIDPSTSTFTKNTISNYIGTEGGSLLWPGGTTTSYCTFINCDYGIEITQTTNQTFVGHQFDDAAGNYDVGLSGGTSIEVAKTGSPSSNANSYYDHTTSGDTVTFTASFDHILEGMEENTEVTYVKQSDSSVLFHVENVTATGTTTYTHSGGDLVDILIFHVNKIPELSNIYGLTLPNGDVTVKIAQFDDVNYVNL